MLTLTNRIDMRPGAVPLIIHLGQYDSDFSLVFELYSSDGTFAIESGTTAMIRGTKTDGNAYDADAAIDISAKTVTVAGSEQMTAAKGRNVYELVLTKSGKVLSTANFILDVERAAMDADTIASESVLKELNAIIAGAETATEAATNAASAADRAEDAAESVSSASAQIATNTADISDLKADLSESVTDLKSTFDTGILTVNKSLSWNPGYVSASGTISSSSTSIFALVNMEQGETVKIHTFNQWVSIISSTAAESVSIGDSVTPILVSYSGGVTDFEYTATEAINLVLCVTAENYTCQFTKNTELFTQISDLQESVESVEAYTNELKPVVQTYKNFLSELTPTDGTIYDVTTGNTLANDNGKTFAPIKITAGVTYYYTNLFGYFSYLKYGDTFSRLSGDTSDRLSGSFIASADGEIGISIHATTTNYVLSESEAIADGVIPNPYAIINAKNVKSQMTFYVEKDGSGDFTSLVDALAFACEYMDSTVYVGSGEWDIISELGQEYINSVSVSKPGIILKNRVHVIFSTDAVVVCNYTGTRDETIQHLSAFNAGPYGFTLENAHIQTKNCRYCVHDERATYTDAYKNHYINCVMTHDNSLVSGARKQGMAQCIGGGLGADGHIIIEGCVFENTNPEYAAIYPVILSYHNTSASSGKSIVDVKGNVLKGRGKARFSWYGTTTDITEFLVHDNFVGAATEHSAETASSTVRNTVMHDWNNAIRS